MKRLHRQKDAPLTKEPAPSDFAHKPVSLAKPSIELRNATTEDVAGIITLVARTYPDQSPYSPAQIRGQINTFPEGQFVVCFDGEIVGYAATFVIPESIGLADHRRN